MNELYASITSTPFRSPGLDLATNRDIVGEPAFGRQRARGRSRTLKWMPAAYRHCGVSRRAATPSPRPSCNSHSGGSVRYPSMHTDRKAIGHVAKAGRCPAPLVLKLFGVHRNNKFPAQSMTWRKAYRWLLARKHSPRETLPASVNSIGGNLAVSLAVDTPVTRGAPLPAAIPVRSFPPWFDMEMKNETWEKQSTADTDCASQQAGGGRVFERRGSAATGVARNDPRVKYALRRSDRPAHRSWSTTAPMRMPARRKPSSSRSERRDAGGRLSPLRFPCLKAQHKLSSSVPGRCARGGQGDRGDWPMAAIQSLGLACPGGGLVPGPLAVFASAKRHPNFKGRSA